MYKELVENEYRLIKMPKVILVSGNGKELYEVGK